MTDTIIDFPDRRQTTCDKRSIMVLTVRRAGSPCGCSDNSQWPRDPYCHGAEVEGKKEPGGKMTREGVKRQAARCQGGQAVETLRMSAGCLAR